MPREILPLTSLRFVAALYVFIFHMQLHFGLPVTGFLKTFLLQGAVGMSLFFILSGFVLSISYGERPTSVERFAIRRVARIVPVYALAALVTVPWFIPATAPDTTNPLAQGAFVLFTSLFFLQAWFPSMLGFWNFGASWSLSVEAFFYALFSPLQRVMTRSSGRSLLAILLVAYVASVLPGLATHLIGEKSNIFYVLPIYRLPEFIVGVAVGTAHNRGFRLPHSKLLFGTTAALLVAGLGSIEPVIYVDMNWLAVPCFAMIIVAAAQIPQGRLRSCLTARWLVYSGHASYSFYSLQILILLVGLNYGASIRTSVPLLADPVLFALTCFVTLYALAAATYSFIEEPARYLLNQHLERREKQPESLHVGTEPLPRNL